MDGLGSGTQRRVDDSLDVEVALPGRWGGSDTDGGVGHGDVAGTGVGVAVDGHRTDAHRLAGADDPHSDLATVGDKHSVEHRHILKTP